MKKYHEVATRCLSRMRFMPKQNGIVAAMVLLSSNPQMASGPNRHSVLEKDLNSLKYMFENSSYTLLMPDFERGVSLLVSLKTF
jgi:hypothetical protein